MDCDALLAIAGTERHPYWWCPRCRVAVLSPRLPRPVLLTETSALSLTSELSLELYGRP
jgi:hypothetical protein